MKNSMKYLVEKLELEPHPEGGYFKETYRSSGEIEEGHLPPGYEGKRNYSTCIYFLLTSGNFSALHRIRQDEVWHFYDGAPLSVHVLTPSGEYVEHITGRDLSQGQVPQLVVPAGCWFGAEVRQENAFSLVGCTVSPGFDFRDFELASESKLITEFPDHAELISRLTRV